MLQVSQKSQACGSRTTEEIAACAVHIVAALVGESKSMSEMDLAQEIIERACRDSILSEYPPELVALSIVGSVPALQDASQEQCQYIFDSLVGALASRQTARIAAKSARWIA